ncbi:uncharacterized protein [Asterias amurensis]|uniref:uncharacterized protein isoform X6 n=1 Tax=Asterias amurensis TaxID=7602 RepID=UPI003AB1FB27
MDRFSSSATHLWVAVALSFLAGALAIPRENLYPFGRENGDSELPVGNTVQRELNLSTPLQFLTQKHSTVYVNTDGVLTLSAVDEVGQPPYRFGTSLKNSQVKTIAPFGADYDTRYGGSVFYREELGTETLRRAAQEISQYFGRPDFRPTSLVIVTWDSLVYRNRDKVLTFQLVIPSDGDQTFVFYIYDDDNTEATDDYSVVGFSNGDGSHLTLNGHVSSFTNVARIGMWAWQVGGTNLGVKGFGQPTINSEGKTSTVSFVPGADGSTGSGGSTTFVIDGGSTVGGGGSATSGVSTGGSSSSGTSTSGSSFTVVVGGGSSSSSGGSTSTGGSTVVVGGGSSGSSSSSGGSTSTGGSSTTVVTVRGNEGGSTGGSTSISIDGSSGGAASGGSASGGSASGGSASGGSASGSASGGSASGSSIYRSGVSGGTGTGAGGFDVNFNVGDQLNPGSRDECDLCHNQASCQEFSQGFCCVCPENMIGNGRSCLASDANQRLNGLVSGRVNGVPFQNANLHSFIQISNGRTFTAISPLDPEISYSLQSITPVAEVMGWLFGLPSGKGLNGFTLTGGKFLQTLNITFSTGENMFITQRFLGVDEEGYIRVNSNWEGTVPEIYPSAYIFVDDHKEEYIRHRLGVIHTFAKRTLQVDEDTLSYTMDQTIEYDECLGDEADTEYILNFMRTSLTETYVQYEVDENILRFSMVGKVTPASEQVDDRCKNNDCDRNAECLPAGDVGYRCKCNPGYQGNGQQCSVSDPCAQHTCDVNANCVPVAERYTCVCNTGYSGDGFTCTFDRCADNVCNVNAQCIPNRSGYECLCNFGFTGDGFNCQVDRCTGNACDVNARCVPSQSGYGCECNNGFTGNGFSCQADDADHCVANTCDPNARCVSLEFGYQCICNQGYRGDGYTCRADPVDPCVNHTCHMNAICVASANATYDCVCSEGYSGDGFMCQASQVDYCANNDCDRNARCLADSTGYQCFCNPGFTGNGRSCNRASQVDYCANNDCDRNARCLADSTGYQCFCNPGFTGNGRSCNRADPVDPCVNHTCHMNAICVASVNATYDCVCSEGYSGDGFMCQETAFSGCDSNNCDRNARCSESQSSSGYDCFCNPGYSGDGIRCDVVVDNRCRLNRCSANGRCLPTQTSYRCVCNPGYFGNGFRCRVLDPCINNRCDFNAACSPAQQGGYTCACNDGYEGDGFTCTNELVNVCSSCDVSAQCIPEGLGFRCVCNSGFQGSGRTCEDIDECSLSGSPCHQYASCYNVRGSFSCYCKQGYTGDGFSCEAILRPDSGEGTLIYARGMAIMKMPLNAQKPGSKIMFRSGQTIVGLGYDCRDEYMYWTDVSGRTISRANIDGSDVQVIVGRGLSSPEGVAVDWLSRNIYWTDSGYDRIEVANLDGGNRRVLFNNDLANPRAIVADPIGGMLYWTDWNRDGPRIERSHLDGGNRTVLVDTNIELPNGLSLDYTSSQICWADAGTKKIECMNMNGDPLTRFTVFPSSNYPFSIASVGFKLYWSDWDTKSIQSISKTGGTESASVKLPRGGNGRVYGITAISTCPSASNACSNNNGGCSSLCLPIPGGQRKCACPSTLEGNEVPCV